MRASVQFRFRVAPGTYRLTVDFAAHEDEATVLVGGLEKTLAMPLNRKEELAESGVIVTRLTTQSVSHQGYGEIRWIRPVGKT